MNNKNTYGAIREELRICNYKDIDNYNKMFYGSLHKDVYTNIAIIELTDFVGVSDTNYVLYLYFDTFENFWNNWERFKKLLILS